MHVVYASSLSLLPACCPPSSEIADRHDLANCALRKTIHSVAPSKRWCEPWQYVCEAECSPTGRSIPFAGGYPEPVISPVGDPLYVFHGALRAGEPPIEDKPVTTCKLLPTGPAWRFHL